MRKILTRYFTIIAMLLLNGLASAGIRDTETADVKVYKQISSSQVTYTYSVTNKGDRPITGLTIGFDYYRGNSELKGEKPLQIVSPNAWAGRIVTLEESDRYEIAWDISAANASILPGQTLSGFQVVSANENPLLTDSNWTVIVDGPPTQASSALLLVDGPAPSTDTIPPQLTVTLSPNVIWPPDSRMVSVTALITVLDDKDPSPVVKLVSITCNECSNISQDVMEAAFGTNDRDFKVRAQRYGIIKDGRIYTVTYSATDASGNTTTVRTLLTVPHDRRKPTTVN